MHQEFWEKWSKFANLEFCNFPRFFQSFFLTEGFTIIILICTFSLHSTSESESEQDVVPEEETKIKQDAENEQPEEPRAELVQEVIVPQDDNKSSMTENFKLAEELIELNFVQLKIVIWIGT